MARVQMPSIGKVSQEQFDKFDPEYKAKLEYQDKLKKKLMSKRGGLKLATELLEERRLEFGIIDDFFSVQPFDDKIIVFQVSRMTGETFEGSSILAPENTRKREDQNNPAGIITAAGAKALDYMRCNGMDLGHMVLFLRVAPWRCEIKKGGVTAEMLMFRVGDIFGSFDLMQELRDGKTKLEYDPELEEHLYIDEDGKKWRPQAANPFMSEDY